MTPISEPFGTLPDGRAVERWTLRNAGGMAVRFLSYGGTIADWVHRGTNIVLGFADLAGYVGHPGEARPYFGALIGRCANRIAGARFTLDGVEHILPANDGSSCMHGGTDGFDRRIWQVHPGDGSATLSMASPDGDNGFPGTLDVSVTYTLTDADELRIDYTARSDRDTVVNLTNHSYFNLAGAGTIDRHVVSIPADTVVHVDPALIPVAGPPAPVDGTPFDLRTPMSVGDALARPHPQLLRARGFDHCWVLPDAPGLRLAATVHDPDSGRTLRCFTDQPGVQFYTGNSLDGSVAGRDGAGYRQGTGFALETEHFPNSPNRPDFPSCVLHAGKEQRWRTVFALGS